MLEQPAEEQPTTNDYGADVASSSLQVCFWAQKTIGNNSCCERNQYRNFVKLAKIKCQNGTPKISSHCSKSFFGPASKAGGGK
jgi:hypothetical protein